MRSASVARRLAWGTLVAAGCHAAPTPVATPRAVTLLPEVPRAVPTPDVTQVAATLPASTPDPGPYLALGAEECRRLAAINSAPARLIDAAANSPTPLPGNSRADDLRRTLGVQLAAEARNRTAASALEAYYRLLEAELVTDALGGAVAELDALNTGLDALAASGLPEPATAPTLREKRLSVRADRETARAGARRLSAELLPVIGAAPGSGRINPTDVISVPGADLDADQAVARALITRPDVNAARALQACVDSRTATAITSALASLSPGLPELPAGLGTQLLTLCKSPDDLQRRITNLREDRELAAAGAVRGAVADWNSARAAVGAAKVRQAQETKRVASEQARESSGVSGAATALRTARLAQIEADVGVLRAAIKWKLADVAVRRELGLLAAP